MGISKYLNSYYVLREIDLGKLAISHTFIFQNFGCNKLFCLKLMAQNSFCFIMEFMKINISFRIYCGITHFTSGT